MEYVFWSLADAEMTSIEARLNIAVSTNLEQLIIIAISDLKNIIVIIKTRFDFYPILYTTIGRTCIVEISDVVATHLVRLNVQIRGRRVRADAEPIV